MHNFHNMFLIFLDLFLSSLMTTFRMEATIHLTLLLRVSLALMTLTCLYSTLQIQNQWVSPQNVHREEYFHTLCRGDKRPASECIRRLKLFAGKSDTRAPLTIDVLCVSSRGSNRSRRTAWWRKVWEWKIVIATESSDGWSEPVRWLDALIVLYDVFVLEKLHDFDFIVEKFSEKLVGNVIFWNNLHSDHRFMAFGKCKLKNFMFVGESKDAGKLYLHFRVTSTADFLDNFEPVTLEQWFVDRRFRAFSYWLCFVAVFRRGRWHLSCGELREISAGGEKRKPTLIFDAVANWCCHCFLLSLWILMPKDVELL